MIFKEGLNVRGLNTAATLWCSSAVGLLAGSGFLIYGVLCAGLVVAANLVLRPLVQAINRQPVDDTEIDLTYSVSVVCKGAEEARICALLLQGLTSTPQIHFHELDSTNTEDTDRVEVTATVTSEKRREIALEYIVGRLSLETGVTRVRWTSKTTPV